MYLLEVDEVNDGCSIRNAESSAVVYSPFAIPHWVEVCTDYHFRTRCSSIKWNLSFVFALCDSSKNTWPEPEQAKRLESMHEEYARFGADLKGELLFSNCFDDPPESGLHKNLQGVRGPQWRVRTWSISLHRPCGE